MGRCPSEQRGCLNGSEFAPDAAVACHACDAWTAAQTTLDVDRGFALATGPLGWTVADLFATSNSADLYENQNHNIAEALNFIRKRYDPKYAMLSPIWNLGEPLKLSHVDLPRPESSSAQAKFIVRHNTHPFDAPLASRMVGSDLIGRALAGLDVAPVERVAGRSETNQIFENLGGFGVGDSSAAFARQTAARGDPNPDCRSDAGSGSLKRVLFFEPTTTQSAVDIPHAKRIFLLIQIGFQVCGDGTKLPVNVG